MVKNGKGQEDDVRCGDIDYSLSSSSWQPAWVANGNTNCWIYAISTRNRIDSLRRWIAVTRIIARISRIDDRYAWIVARIIAITWIIVLPARAILIEK